MEEGGEGGGDLWGIETPNQGTATCRL
jgi:hypothetical protein